MPCSADPAPVIHYAPAENFEHVDVALIDREDRPGEHPIECSDRILPCTRQRCPANAWAPQIVRLPSVSRKISTSLQVRLEGGILRLVKLVHREESLRLQGVPRDNFALRTMVLAHPARQDVRVAIAGCHQTRGLSHRA
jgi:hypothetical protein